MFNNIILFTSLLVQISFWHADCAVIPNYVKLCKRDPDTIDDCVRNSIEAIRPKLVAGIPELKVPPIEPLTIPEIVIDQGNVVRFKAVGRDVKLSGASNFKLKSLRVDLDTLQINVGVYFPQLKIDGKYDVDARLLLVPIHGKGDIRANATKCYANVFLQGVLENRNGEDYLQFVDINTELDIGDYTLRVTNLFNGNAQLGDVANLIIDQNKVEFLRASKPYLERTVSGFVLKLANKIAGDIKFDDILALP